MNTTGLAWIVGFALTTVTLFILIWKFDGISFMYDFRVSENGVEFILISFLQVYFLPFSDIEFVKRVKGGYFNIFAYSFKNRFFRETFLIKKKRGIFTRQILITPDNAVEFIKSLNHAGVQVDL